MKEGRTGYFYRDTDIEKSSRGFIMQEKKKARFHVHYAWVIMISCFFFFGLSMGAFTNTQGLYYAAIAKDLGWNISKVSGCTVFLGLSSVAALAVVDKIFNRYDVRPVLFISQAVFTLTIVLRGFCSQIWQFSLVYIITGISSAFLWYVPVPMLIKNWFKKWTGLALSLSLCSGGIAGFILNPIFSRMIEKNGWRYTTVFQGILMAVVTLPIIALLIRKKPEDMGLTALGAGTQEEKEQSPENGNISGTQAKTAAASDASSPKGYLTSPVLRKCFILSIIIAFLACLISTIPQQFAHFATVNGLSASTGALLVSISMIGNLTGKVTMGPAADLFGKRKSFAVFFLAASAGMVLMVIFGTKAGIPLFVGAFLTGIVAPNSGVAVPLLVAEYSDGDAYTFFISKVTIAHMVAYAFGSYISSGLYDLTGNYAIPLLTYAAAGIVALILIFRVLASASACRKT